MTTVRVVVSQRSAQEPPQRGMPWLEAAAAPSATFAALPWLKRQYADEPSQEPTRAPSVPWYYASAVSISSAWILMRRAPQPPDEGPSPAAVRPSSVPWYVAPSVSVSSAWRPIWHPQPMPLEEYPPPRAPVRAYLWAYPTFLRAPSRTYISRVPDVRGRLRRFTDEVATLLDSLIAQNILLQLGPMSWTLRNVATEIAGPPGASHDFPRGYRVGAVVIDTLTGDAYVCTTHTAGAAVWKKIT
jgi:hypothetical protein